MKKVLLAGLLSVGLFLALGGSLMRLSHRAQAQGPDNAQVISTPPAVLVTATLRLPDDDIEAPDHRTVDERTMQPRAWPAQAPISLLATTAAGVISGTWDISGSPYVVTGDLVIASGSVLTIQAGVEVRFAGYYRLTVEGDLVADGTAAAPITFTSQLTSPQPGDWRGIRFYNSGSNDRLSHVWVEFASTGIAIDAYSGSASPVIEYSTITNNSFGGVSISADAGTYDAYARPQILTSTISNNGGDGIYVYGEGGGDSDDGDAAPTIRHNIITNNGGVGINLYGRGGSGIYADGYARGDIIDNVISNNGSYGIRCHGYGGSSGCQRCYGSVCFPSSCIDGSASPKINDNVIANNADTGIHISANGRSNGTVSNTGESSPRIINNFIANNRGHGFRAYASDSYDDLYPSLVNNTIVSNTLAGLQTTEEAFGIDVYNNLLISNTTGLDAYANETPDVRCNGIWGNATAFSNYPAAYGVITTTNVNGTPTDLYDNIFLEPRFVNASAGDYHLLSSSPAIDAGCDHYYAPSTDLDGDPRPQGAYYDLGIDEFRYSVGAVTLSAAPTTLDVGQTVQLTATVVDINSVPLANLPVAFTTTLGQLGGGSFPRITNAGGVATVTLTSTITGTAIVTAMINSIYDTAQVTFHGPPSLAGLPDQTLSMNASLDNAIDLWAYAADEDADANLRFSITHITDVNAGVAIDSNRYIDINPTFNWTGTATVTVVVTDTGGLTDTDSFVVTVNGPPSLTGLPDQALSMNGSLDNAIDLWAYASDGEDTDAILRFSISNVSDAHAGVTIDASGRYIDINPATDWSGSADVTVVVTDTGGLTDADSFTVVVIAPPVSNTQPSLAGLPDQTLPMNGSLDNAIDLWTYASDAEDADVDLRFSISNVSDARVGVTIDASGRYIDINPAANWSGSASVTVEVADTGSMADTGTFTVNVRSMVYLPLIVTE